MPDRRARHHRLRAGETGEAFPQSAPKLRTRCHDLLLFCSQRTFFILILWTLSNQAAGQSINGDQGAANKNPYDIAVVIDNRLIADQPVAKRDVDALIEMIDRQMFIEHIIRLERPTIEVVCDIFGGCPDPDEIANPWPSLIWQITREGQARIVVYYLGRGRIEGNRRQLLFKRSNGSRPGDEMPYDVGWMHFQLANAKPKSAVVFMDTSFAPRALPCASEDPLLIDQTMVSVRRNFRRTVAGKSLPKGLAELTASLPVEASHCDRYDLTLGSVKRPLFTKFLMEGIAGGEADKEPYGDQDTFVELAELAAYTNDRIKRTVRFQWGREQNVWWIGPASRRLASVDRRRSTQHRSKVRLAKAEPENTSADGKRRRDSDRQNDDANAAVEKPAPAGTTPGKNCGNDTDSNTCHPCVDDPVSDACRARCQTDQNVDLCAKFLTSTTESSETVPPPGPAGAPMTSDVQENARASEATETPEITESSETERTSETSSALETTPTTEAVTTQEPAEADPCADRPESPECASTWCRRSAKTAGPAATKLIEALGRDKESACRWAGSDENAEDESWYSKIFAPIGWKLSRAKVRDSVYCLLDCDRLAATSSAPAGADGPEKPAVKNAEPESKPGPDLNPQLKAGEAREKQLTPSAEQAPPTEKVKPVPPAERKTAKSPSAQPAPTAEHDAEQPPSSTSSPIETAKQTRPQPAPKGFEPSVSEIRWLQSALTVDNHNPGPIDGSLGPMTMKAVRSWRRANDIEVANHERNGAKSDPLTEKEFNAIVTAFGERFGHFRRDASLF